MSHPSRSWTRSREARLWQSLDPAEAGRVVVMAYGENAGAEVLLRAFLAERDCSPVAVRFWLNVYERISPTPPARRAGRRGNPFRTPG